MRVTMLLLLQVTKMLEPRKDLVLEEEILPLEEANIMQVETVQADTVQQVIRYLLAKSIQFSIIVHRGGRRI